MEHRTLSRYELQQVIDIRNEYSQIMDPYQLDGPITVLGNVIEVMTEETSIPTPITHFYKEPGYYTKVMVKVNGKEAASPSLAHLKPDNDTDTRFLSWLNILKVTDTKTGAQKVAIVQRISGENPIGENIDQFINNQTWRIIYLDNDKKVTTEQFSYPERGKHMLGTFLVIFSSEAATFMGLSNDSLSYLPSYLYPFWYPEVTLFFGIVFSIIGTILIIRRKANRHKD